MAPSDSAMRARNQLDQRHPLMHSVWLRHGCVRWQCGQTTSGDLSMEPSLKMGRSSLEPAWGRFHAMGSSQLPSRAPVVVGKRGWDYPAAVLAAVDLRLRLARRAPVLAHVFGKFLRRVAPE